MKRYKLKNICISIFYATALTSCQTTPVPDKSALSPNATVLFYKPLVNSDHIKAMQSIKEKILKQPKNMAPRSVDVKESHFIVEGSPEVEKTETLYPSYSGGAAFEGITDLVLHQENGWFMVTIIHGYKSLFRYYSHDEADAKQFMDNIYTMMQFQHKNDRVVNNKAVSVDNPKADSKKSLIALLESIEANPDKDIFNKAEPMLLGYLTSVENSTGKDRTAVVVFASKLAILYQAFDEYGKAENELLKNLERSRKIGVYSIEFADSLNDLGTLYTAQGRYSEAGKMYQESLSIKERFLGNEHKSTALSLSNLARLRFLQGFNDDADSLNQRSLEVMDHVLLKEHLINSDRVHWEFIDKLNKYDKKNKPKMYEPKFSQGKTSEVEAIISLIGTGIFLIESSIYYTQYFLGKFDIDMDSFLNENHELENTIILAKIYYQLHKYDESEKLFKSALELYEAILGKEHPIVASTLNNIGENYLALGKYDLAETSLKKALEINEKKLGKTHSSVADVLSNLALFYAAQDKHDQAKPLFQRSLALMNLTLNDWLRGAGEKTRRAYLQQQEAKRNYYLSFYNLTNAAEEALNFSLGRKGLLLRISSEEGAIAAKSSDPEVKKLLQEQKTLRSELSNDYLSTNVDPTKNQAKEEKLNELGRQLSQRIQGANLNQTDVTAVQVLNSLKPEQSLVDFLVYRPYDFKTRAYTTEQVIALVANKQSGIQLVKLGDYGPITENIKKYRTAIDEDDNESNKKSLLDTAQKLYEKLWLPLTPYLKDTRTVFVIPDGQLNIMPFKALQDKNGNYLATQHEIINLSSARDLVLPREIETHTQAAIIAGVDYGAFSPHGIFKDPWIPLAFTLREGQQIERLIRSKQPQFSAKLLTKTKADEQAVETLNSPKFLHFATHGFYQGDVSNDENSATRGLIFRSTPTAFPMIAPNPLTRVGLALAGANLGFKGHSDGILSALEVLNLNLSGTDLVTLSACKTGTGDIKTGEGVYSLNRAFQEAGAKAVLSTLWDVDDEATGLFMQKFYARFLSNKSVQQAFQETQQDFIQDKNCKLSEGAKCSNPVFWAGFVMTGG